MESPPRSNPTSPSKSASASETKPSRRIKVLREDVARKIAAGEVIDRPSAVLRELLDNSLDARAQRIEVLLRQGGLELLQVADDGLGMNEEDLRLSILPHATSKIETEEDLLHLHTLGFRGEALASIAAVSELTLHSANHEGRGAQLTVRHGNLAEVRPLPRSRGTTATVRDLFWNLPARRKFLKSPRSEATACLRVFEEKALAFPHVAFSWQAGEDEPRHLSPQSRRDRAAAVLREEGLVEIGGPLEGGDFSAVYLPPPAHRRDRSGIQIFVNHRRVFEYSLVQAVEYAFGDHLSGGTYPLCLLFLQLDPALVDFNIHPAKREVKIRHQAAVHHALTRALKEGLRRHYPSISPSQAAPAGLWVAEAASGRAQGETRSTDISPSPTPKRDWRYLGQVGGTYLVVERQGQLVLIDQHAAHERLNYDRLRAQRLLTQPLLVPLEVEVEEEVSRFWAAHPDLLQQLGIEVEVHLGCLRVLGLPHLLRDREAEVAAWLAQPQGEAGDWEQRFYATMACRLSIRARDPLEPAAAEALIEQVFALPEPRCPHGRPLWVVFDNPTLERLFGRSP